VAPFPDSLLFRKSVAPEIEPGTSGTAARNSDHWTREAVISFVTRTQIQSSSKHFFSSSGTRTTGGAPRHLGGWSARKNLRGMKTRGKIFRSKHFSLDLYYRLCKTSIIRRKIGVQSREKTFLRVREQKSLNTAVLNHPTLRGKNSCCRNTFLKDVWFPRSTQPL
jgi:hypothetical protein